jgi:hypothetical protein
LGEREGGGISTSFSFASMFLLKILGKKGKLMRRGSDTSAVEDAYGCSVERNNSGSSILH